ncbi:MAG: MerR family transcriptional regulator [Eubacteriales bacterium]|nr:MerR family transcriptional regulator [Eubacteriales bacterium]
MKTYTIKEASAIMNLPASTLRYYDSQGLLPFIERRESGYRIFSENDIALLRVIECLKRSGLSIKDIRHFTELLWQGDASLPERLALFQRQRKAVEAQMAELQKTLDVIDHKCRYYQAAVEAGTERIHQSDDAPEWKRLQEIYSGAAGDVR